MSFKENLKAKINLHRLLQKLVSTIKEPPGTSKWNKIEHRLFSFISMNWRGKPLVSHEVIVNLIAATRTKSGLRVKNDRTLTKDEVPV